MKTQVSLQKKSSQQRPIWLLSHKYAPSQGNTHAHADITTTARPLCFGPAHAEKTAVPRAGDDRTLCRKRSSPARGTTFSSTGDALRMQSLDIQSPLLSRDFAARVGSGVVMPVMPRQGALATCSEPNPWPFHSFFISPCRFSFELLLPLWQEMKTGES